MLLSRFQTSLLLGGALLLAAIPASANLLVTNGSFENQSIAPGSYVYNSVNCNYPIPPDSVTPVCGPVTIANWTYVDTPIVPPGNSGGSGISSVGSAFGNTTPAPDGTQALFLQNQSSASQTIAGIQAGDTYTISFYVEQRAYGSQQTLDVTLGDQTLFSGTAPSSSAYTLETGSIVADQSGSLALTFAGQQSALGNTDATVFVDKVNLTPEPGFYWLLALGLGGLVTVVSRRKKEPKA